MALVTTLTTVAVGSLVASAAAPVAMPAIMSYMAVAGPLGALHVAGGFVASLQSGAFSAWALGTAAVSGTGAVAAYWQ
jgi:hypothetical protein